MRLPAIFSDHMILQRSEDVRVWGEGESGEEITVTLSCHTRVTTAGPDGRWSVSLDLAHSEAGPFEMRVQGNDRITISDVLIGEVWLAAGQSNMAWKVRDSADPHGEIAASQNPQIRIFQVEHSALANPAFDCPGQWVVAGLESTGDFTAVGYYFAKRLQHQLCQPVGILSASWDATPVEAWMSREAYDSLPDLEFVETAEEPQKRAGFLFNGMIHPLTAYAIKGAIWYQGESNICRASQYQAAFRLLIEDWRRAWGRGAWPFYFCQLANFGAKTSLPGDSSWALLREAQAGALQLPGTAMAVLIDLGEAGDIHPRNKRDVGERLARIALARDYHESRVWSGPFFRSMQAQGGKVRIAFDRIGRGLWAKPLPKIFDVRSEAGETAPLERNVPGSQLEGFEISDGNGNWRWALAEIEGGEVIAWSDAIGSPTAARYAWSDNPTCNLYNTEGLPAAPFQHYLSS